MSSYAELLLLKSTDMNEVSPTQLSLRLRCCLERLRMLNSGEEIVSHPRSLSIGRHGSSFLQLKKAYPCEAESSWGLGQAQRIIHGMAKKGRG